MKMILSAVVALSASIALANSPAHKGHGETKEMTKTTTTTETKKAETKPMVDCKDAKNKDMAECKKAH